MPRTLSEEEWKQFWDKVDPAGVHSAEKREEVKLRWNIAQEWAKEANRQEKALKREIQAAGYKLIPADDVDDFMMRNPNVVATMLSNIGLAVIHKAPGTDTDSRNTDRWDREDRKIGRARRHAEDLLRTLGRLRRQIEEFCLAKTTSPKKASTPKLDVAAILKEPSFWREVADQLKARGIEYSPTKWAKIKRAWQGYHKCMQQRKEIVGRISRDMSAFDPHVIPESSPEYQNYKKPSGTFVLHGEGLGYIEFVNKVPPKSKVREWMNLYEREGELAEKGETYRSQIPIGAQLVLTTTLVRRIQNMQQAPAGLVPVEAKPPGSKAELGQPRRVVGYFTERGKVRPITTKY